LADDFNFVEVARRRTYLLESIMSLDLSQLLRHDAHLHRANVGLDKPASGDPPARAPPLKVSAPGWRRVLLALAVLALQVAPMVAPMVSGATVGFLPLTLGSFSLAGVLVLWLWR
jgi:hypothetical protein